MHFRSFALLSLLAVAALALSPAKADSATVGMSARDEAMVSAATFLSYPPVLDVIATLKAPVTTYELKLSEEWAAQYTEMAKKLDEVGVKIGQSTPKYGEFTWSGEISCGRLGDPKAVQFTWSHPDGPPPNCPHEQGTDHPGTITVSNLRFRYALREAIDVDDGHVTNETMAQMNAAPKLAEYSWLLECRYTDGSKPGRVRCTGTLQTGQAAAAGTGAGANTNATNTNAAGQGQGSGAGAAGAAAGGAVVVGGGLAYWWYRRPFDWQDIQRKWKIKK